VLTKKSDELDGKSTPPYNVRLDLNKKWMALEDDLLSLQKK